MIMFNIRSKTDEYPAQSTARGQDRKLTKSETKNKKKRLMQDPEISEINA